MKDHDHAVDPCDLSKRLNRIQKLHSVPNDGDHVSRRPRRPQPEGTTSSSPTSTLSRFPTFRKTATMSTTSSSSTQLSRLEVMGVRRRSLSKSRAGTARRRQSGESTKSAPDFQYYGRHANTWLFNDWSLSESVRKGLEKVFKGKGE